MSSLGSRAHFASPWISRAFSPGPFLAARRLSPWHCPGTAAQMRHVLCVFSWLPNQSVESVAPQADRQPSLQLKFVFVNYQLTLLLLLLFLPYRFFFLYVYFLLCQIYLSFRELLNFVSWLETTIPSQYYFKSPSFGHLCFYLLLESFFCMQFILE